MTLLSSVFLLDIECWDETFYLYLQLSKDAIPLSLVPIVSAGMSAPILTLFPVPYLTGVHFLLRLTLQFLFNSLLLLLV